MSDFCVKLMEMKGFTQRRNKSSDDLFLKQAYRRQRTTPAPKVIR